MRVAVQRKLVERAKQMTEEDSPDRSNQKEALQQEFEQLLNIFFTGARSSSGSSSFCAGGCSRGSIGSLRHRVQMQ